MRYSIYATVAVAAAATAAAAAAVSTPMSRNNECNYFAFYYNVPILYFIFLLTAYLHACLCYIFIYYIIYLPFIILFNSLHILLWMCTKNAFQSY